MLAGSWLVVPVLDDHVEGLAGRALELEPRALLEELEMLERL
jgi:hypothetical protein